MRVLLMLRVGFLTGLMLLAGSSRAQDQVLLDQVNVTPLPGPASCYAGTSGTDHVVFVRVKSSQADCDVTGGGPLCLARREFPSDGANGRPVSLRSTIVLRPFVTGAGDLVAFAELGFNACFMATASEDTEGCFGRDFLGADPHSVSISPDGTRVALTRLDPGTQFQPTNDIFVVRANDFLLLESYEVVDPASPLVVLEVDTVDFTVDGDFLIADGRNPITGLWGIYAVSRTTGATSTVVAPVAGLHLRNPALAQTSDDHIVFDAQDPLTGATTVFAANLLTGVRTQVAQTLILSYPSYTGDDGAVVFSEFDNSVVTLSSMDIQPLAGDRMTPTGTRSRWLTDGGVPAIYRRGAWSGVLLDPAVCGQPAIICGDLDESGARDADDVTVFRSHLADPVGNPLSAGAVARCNVIGAPGPCSIPNVAVLIRDLAGLPPFAADVCAGLP